ncbi:MAG: hypothetical protein H6838_17330 [Planctomycetes bacterium]|nr:hypothetical protein [Planctomycetota bacterium]MCB9887256.1 hypothetical protein [Planctomycetota bacterium]
MPQKQRSVGGRLLLFANVVGANAVAALFVVAFVRPQALGFEWPVPGQDARVLMLPLGTTFAWFAFAAALALLLLNFAWLVRRSGGTPPEPFVLSETPTGVVRIAREALESALQKAGEALPEVTRMRVQVTPQGPRKFLVRGQFHCAEGSNSLAASQRLRVALADRCAELVRLADGGRAEYELEFCGFSGKLGKGAEVAPPVDDGVPFTGPRYPIDDDSNMGGLS